MDIYICSHRGCCVDICPGTLCLQSGYCVDIKSQQLLCGQGLLVHSSFPYLLHSDVWLDTPASISAEQPITQLRFGRGFYGLWQMKYSLFVV